MNDSDMRLLLLIGAFRLYGKEFIGLQFIKCLLKNNYKFKVISLSGEWTDGKFNSKLNEMGVEYESYYMGWYYFTKILWSFDSLIHYPSSLMRFLRIKKNIKPDYIYVDSYRPIILLYPFLKKNIIYHVHDTNSASKQGKYFTKISDRKVIKYIAVSEFIGRDLAKCGIDPSKIEVIYNCIEMPRKTEKACEVGSILLHIGIVGQVVPWKGHSDLLKALSLIDKHVKYHLHIVGTGFAEYELELKKWIGSYDMEQNVSWHGRIEDKEDIYSLFDILLAPSKHEEAFGLIVAEAGYFKIPAIVTNSGGLVEIVENKVSGFIVEKNSPSQIAGKIEYFFNNKEKIVDMGNNAEKLVRDKFSFDAFSLKVVNFLNRLDL